jgi:hypothetical protein
MFNKKLWISVFVAFAVFVTSILGFIVIPNQLAKFRGASLLAAGTNTQSVSGLGSNAVMVGDYLYFTSGYRELDTVFYKTNEHGKVKNAGDGGIWRIKLPEGRPEYDNSYLVDFYNTYKKSLEDKGFDFPQMMELGRFGQTTNAVTDALDKRVAKNTLELVVPKIAGWEKTGIWIYGNTLIYSTPNNLKNKYGVLQKNAIDFYACNLNGKNHRLLYTTKTGTGNDTDASIQRSDFTVVWSGAPYLIVKDGGKLVSISMNGKKHTISSSVASFAFPYVTGYYKGYELAPWGGTAPATGTGSVALGDDFQSLGNTYGGIMGYIFYTESITENDDEISGNKFFAYNVAAKRSTKINITQLTYEIVKHANGALIYKTTDTAGKSKTFVTRTFDLSQSDRIQDIKSGEDIYVSGERTQEFSYIGIQGYTARVYRPTGSGEFPPYSTVIKEFMVESATILEMNANEIIYVNDKTYSTVNYLDPKNADGSIKKISATTYQMNSAKVTHLRLLDKNGNISVGTRSSAFFFLAERSEIVDPNAISGGVTSISTIEFGCIVTADGTRDYILERLDISKYVPMPTKMLE